ncbi:MAG TPA: YggS family pyridoxal phosphate-dependent enzyme [Thermoanaerobaculaceae bacterium]|nr:YggS family pyridoxal phosphate-dependent enzyme [Thermoanaerobaculaceae bacterium]
MRHGAPERQTKDRAPTLSFQPSTLDPVGGGPSVTLEQNLAAVRERMAAACRRAGRPAGSARLVAVSKTHPGEVVAAVVALGVDAIGENRVQEAAVKRRHVPRGTPWHLVGPLQRNKARLALDTFDLVESVDRIEIADRLELLLAPENRILPVFIEVNIGEEPQKSGVLPEGAEALAGHVLARCPHLRLGGLMCIPPYDPNPERSRPHFVRLRELAKRLAPRLGLDQLELSMGMSEDFEVAIEEGADWVRVGRALFGERGG